MKQDPKKKREIAPLVGQPSELEAKMDPRPLPEGVASSSALLDDLAHWDELPPERLTALLADPGARARFALLQRVEELLKAGILPAGPCPEAEELYDYGRGPGYEPMSLERRRAVELHVDRCPSCADLVHSLAASPPLPLDMSPPAKASDKRGTTQGPPAMAPFGLTTAREEAAGPFALDGASNRTASRGAPSEDDPFAEARSERWNRTQRSAQQVELGPHWQRSAGAAPEQRRWLSRAAGGWIAAAAAALAALAYWPKGESKPQLPTLASWPEQESLRGSIGNGLIFPRGVVLAPPIESDAVRGRRLFAENPIFLVAEMQGAELYSITLSQNDGSVFSEDKGLQAAEGKLPWMRLNYPLAPGNYTWEAWATVGKIKHYLGARSFEVRRDDELLRQIEGLEDLPALRLLHERNYLTDARTLAENMQPSTERDTYLNSVPGR